MSGMTQKLLWFPQICHIHSIVHWFQHLPCSVLMAEPKDIVEHIQCPSLIQQYTKTEVQRWRFRNNNVMFMFLYNTSWPKYQCWNISYIASCYLLSIQWHQISILLLNMQAIWLHPQIWQTFDQIPSYTLRQKSLYTSK